MPLPNLTQDFVDAIIELFPKSSGGIESSDIKEYFARHGVAIEGLALSQLFRDLKRKRWAYGPEYMATTNREIHGAFKITRIDDKILGWGSQP